MNANKLVALLMIGMSIALAGCGDKKIENPQKSVQVSTENKVNEEKDFEDNYAKLYEGVWNNVIIINRGYEDVKNNRKYLVDYHNELDQAKSSLLSQKQEIIRLKIPTSINNKIIDKMINGIDKLCVGIDSFQQTRNSTNVNYINAFEKSVSEGSSLIKDSNYEMESAIKKMNKQIIAESSNDIDVFLNKQQTIPSEQLPNIGVSVNNNQGSVKVTFKNNTNEELINCETRIYAFDSAGNLLSYDGVTRYKEGLSVFGLGDDDSFLPGMEYTGTWTISEFSQAKDILVVIAGIKYKNGTVWKRTLDNQEGLALTARTN